MIRFWNIHLTLSKMLNTVISTECIYYRPPKKLRKSNVFTGICLSTGWGRGWISLSQVPFGGDPWLPGPFWGWVGIPVTRSLPGRYQRGWVYWLYWYWHIVIATEAGSTHPTGMLSCLTEISRLKTKMKQCTVLDLLYHISVDVQGMSRCLAKRRCPGFASCFVSALRPAVSSNAHHPRTLQWNSHKHCVKICERIGRQLWHWKRS